MLNIISADEQIASGGGTGGVKIVFLGPTGVGKTTQAKLFDPKRTLFADLEAGMLALPEDWRRGAKKIHIREQAVKLGVHPWILSRAIACLLAGPDPAGAPGTPYARDQYELYCKTLGDPGALMADIDTIFVDSITVASRHSFSWSSTQPRAFSEKTGKPDTRGAYGLHGQEGTSWLTQLQHIKNKDVVVSGIIHKDTDDMGRTHWKPQIDGNGIINALPGIFDEIFVMNYFAYANDQFSVVDGNGFRAIATQSNNPWGFPCKDRSGTLAPVEPPDLPAIIKKIKAGVRIDTTQVAIQPQPQTAPAQPATAA